MHGKLRRFPTRGGETKQGLGKKVEGVRTCKHGYDAQDDLLDALHWTPTLRGLFIMCGIVTGCV